MISFHVFCSRTVERVPTPPVTAPPPAVLLPLESIPYCNIYAGIKQNNQAMKCDYTIASPTP